MNALFEDGGKFHVGRVMSETEFRVTWMNDRYNRPGTRCC